MSEENNMSEKRPSLCLGCHNEHVFGFCFDKVALDNDNAYKNISIGCDEYPLTRLDFHYNKHIDFLPHLKKPTDSFDAEKFVDTYIKTINAVKELTLCFITPKQADAMKKEIRQKLERV